MISLPTISRRLESRDIKEESARLPVVFTVRDIPALEKYVQLLKHADLIEEIGLARRPGGYIRDLTVWARTRRWEEWSAYARGGGE